MKWGRYMAEAKVVRDEAGRYLKGSVANPTGGLRDIGAARLKLWSSEDMRKIYDRIWDLIEDGDTKCTTKASLLLSLLDRAAGKVKHEVSEKRDLPDGETEPVETLSGQKLLEKIDQFERILAAKSIGPKVQDGIVRVVEGELV
jgi:hypothetical protein